MRILIILGCFFFFTNLFSQNGNRTTDMQKSGGPVNVDSIVYWNARIHGDYGVAVNALYYMMAKNPQRSVAYKDSLATIYYLAASYQKCAAAGTEVLSLQPDNFRIMEIVAISQRILGNTRTSLELYEILYSKTASLTYAYFIAEMQFNLQRYGECMTTLEKLISSENSKKEKIELIVTSDTKQTVALLAAALNIKGMTYGQLGKKEAAREAFKSALSVEKDFALPKINLEKIDKK